MRGSQQPAGLAILNGWLDLTNSGSSVAANAGSDFGLRRDLIEQGAELYRGTSDAADPELSPVFADLNGLPPTYLQVGTHDLLLDDSDRFAERARAAGVDVGYARFDGMWHDFQLAAGLLREADEAMADLGRALDDIWAGRPLAERASVAFIGSSNGGAPRAPRVAIIGAGFGGLGLAITLKKAGVEELTIFEKADGVGGVWRHNTYPGATCDVPSLLYSFSFEPNPDWTRQLLAAAGDPRLPRALRIQVRPRAPSAPEHGGRTR